MINVLLYGHAGSHNHGCEAIVRSTTYILSQCCNVNIIVASSNPDKDEKYIQDVKNISFFISKNKFFLPPKIMRYIDGIGSRTIGIVPFCKYRNLPTIELAKKCDIAFSIGGDNYSENNGVLLSDIDINVRKKCSKTVLWGCSLDKKYLNPKKYKKKFNNLREFDLITARESITYNSLLELGFDNVKLYPDPAFTLPVDNEVPKIFKEKETVGINVSPLIKRFENRNGIVIKNYVKLIEYLLNVTEYDIALIPHVVWPESASDILVLQTLLGFFPKSNRVKLIPDGNCMKIKGYISRCKFFIGARTHSTIAAYSTCIPTLAVGYSVKAKGIAKDIFGTYEDYVLPVQSLQNEDDLLKAFIWLQNNENEIKTHLETFMPSYIRKAWQAGDEIKRILGDKNWI